VFEEIGLVVGIADQASNIGYIYAVKGEIPEAIGWFEKARQGTRHSEETKAGLAARNIQVLRAHSGNHDSQPADGTTCPCGRKAPGAARGFLRLATAGPATRGGSGTGGSMTGLNLAERYFFESGFPLSGGFRPWWAGSPQAGGRRLRVLRLRRRAVAGSRLGPGSACG